MKRLAYVLVGISLIAAMVTFRVVDPYPLPSIRLAYFDFLQRLSPRDKPDLPVRVVDIDEQSLQAFGQWPWPRDLLAELNGRLAEYGVAAIGYDILFVEPDRYSPINLWNDADVSDLFRPDLSELELQRLDNDLVFAAASAQLPVVLGIAAARAQGKAVPLDKAGFVFLGADPAAGLIQTGPTTGVVPSLAEAASGFGGINVSPLDTTETVRRVPLVWSTQAGPLPSLGLETLRVALGESTFFVEGSSDLEGSITQIQLGPFAIPTTDKGQIWVKYRPDDPDLYVSAQAVLAPDFNPELVPKLNGNLVLIGTSAAGLFDIRTTALGETVPGVSVHAQIIEQILSGEYLQRSDFIVGMEILAFVALGIAVTVMTAFSGATPSLISGGTAGIIVLTASWISFARNGVLFDATFPLLGGMVNFAMMSAYQYIVSDRDKRRIRRTFTQYVASEVIDDIERRGHKIELSGEDRVMTIMFCDLRNFTSLSERTTPTELVSILNDLFTRLSACILEEKGTIDKFIGDSVMAFWNAPLYTPDHAARACHAALKMRGALEIYNSDRQLNGLDKIEFAIGIATGLACVGNIGSRQRFNYSVIGDTVNVAARLESSCRHVDADIVISGETSQEAPEMAVLPAGWIDLKGKSNRLGAFALIGDEDLAKLDAFQSLESAFETAVAMASVSSEPDSAAHALKECHSLAARVHPGLGRFLARVPVRAADYRDAEG